MNRRARTISRGAMYDAATSSPLNHDVAVVVGYTKARNTKLAAVLATAGLTAALALSGCAGQTSETSNEQASSQATSSLVSSAASSSTASENASVTPTASSPKVITEADITINETYEDTSDGGHAIQVDAQSAEYSNVGVTKTGEADGDEADFYGENAAIFATNGGTLDIAQAVIKTNGTHANAIFSYGEGTTVNVSDAVIETTGNCSGGLMTTGGGTMNATNLNITTSGNSSAAIRSDRGGGTVNVVGGSYATSGMGSPAIYSTADITVSDAALSSTSAQGVVVEGKNSVTLNNVDLTASNTSKNSDKSEYYQAVMIYQSMSGDAAQGEASFTMNGGTLTNLNGDIFFVNNTVATINLDNATITNQADGVLLRAAAAGWGSEGSNGGQVTLRASNQQLEGDMLVDAVSHLNLYLSSGSTYSGAINPDGAEGDVYVEVEEGSRWVLTGDSYITGLTCGTDAIDLNGHTLYVNGEAYTQGSASQGEAIEAQVSAGGMGGGMGEPPSGAPGEGGEGGAGGAGGTPPEKPGEGAGGVGSASGTPPEKP